MFFTGDPSNKKRVDLGGRSSKERDQQKLLEQTRLERNRRHWLRQQISAALKIQKCFRGRKVVNAERSKVREKFFLTYGKYCQDVNRQCFGPDSDFLRQLLFFFNPKFATGCSRGPFLGFRYLEPTFCIQRTAGNASEDALERLPTAATCMNLLKLPPYQSKQQMEQKLLYAISFDAGFDLS